MEGLFEALALTSYWELSALLLALAYLVLAAHQSQWCWLMAAVSCSIYTVLFWHSKLYMESFLQLCYIFLAGYGWWQWQYQVQQAASQVSPQGARYSWRWHWPKLLVVAAIACVCALLLAHYTDAEQPWLDSFTTCYSLFATYLVAQKARETWWYWLVIDAVYVYLYAVKGFTATALLFVLYLLLVLYAMWRWRQDSALGSSVCSENG